jgi:hypothetical protein
MEGGKEGRLTLEGRMRAHERRHRTGRSCELRRGMLVGDVEVLYACYKCSSIQGTFKLGSIDEGARSRGYT